MEDTYVRLGRIEEMLQDEIDFYNNAPRELEVFFDNLRFKDINYEPDRKRAALLAELKSEFRAAFQSREFKELLRARRGQHDSGSLKSYRLPLLLPLPECQDICRGRIESFGCVRLLYHILVEQRHQQQEQQDGESSARIEFNHKINARQSSPFRLVLTQARSCFQPGKNCYQIGLEKS